MRFLSYQASRLCYINHSAFFPAAQPRLRKNPCLPFIYVVPSLKYGINDMLHHPSPCPGGRKMLHARHSRAMEGDVAHKGPGCPISESELRNVMRSVAIMFFCAAMRRWG
jgi:hypothetical protein